MLYERETEAKLQPRKGIEPTWLHLPPPPFHSDIPFQQAPFGALQSLDHLTGSVLKARNQATLSQFPDLSK